MKTPAVKGLFAAAAAVVLAATPLVGRCVMIDVTKVQQRYPWNGLVDIDYKITRSGDEGELNAAKHSIEITVVNCGVTPAVTNVAHVFRQGTLPVSDGTHRVTWDANAEGVNFKSQDVKVFAEVVHYAEKYMVIDVSAGPGDDAVYPVTYLHGAPADGFCKDEYRGSNIVLRLIPPGMFVMGSPTTEPGRSTTAARETQHVVAITRPFYIGVFEITQKQYANVMNANPSQYKDDCHPVENVSYHDIRGTANVTTHRYDWPWTNEVVTASFMGNLRAKCKEWDSDKQDFAKDIDGLFDLPTEAQWEYACRAGTMTPFNNGEPCADAAALDAQLKKLGRYASDKSDNKGGFADAHTVVGSYASNAWGLYDMHGNVLEWCLDWYKEDEQNIKNPSVDPVGAADGSVRVLRGGCFDSAAKESRSALRGNFDPSKGYAYIGFRLSSSLP